MRPPCCVILFSFLLFAVRAGAADESKKADRELSNYFRAQTAQISASSLSNIQSLADWQARRPELHRQAAEMLGLDPMPERTELHPVITGKLEREDFTVEKIYFQSRPHLYVTANLYLPKNLSKPAPAILYLCGHSPVITNGVSCGNKTAYQHHGIWFARNGYVCMVLDTVQWGEILGHHHGTYSEGAWWWNSRGYTPAGVETWNAIRALDYLVSRPEVDAQRIGVTGRSGGGAYSWFVGALDDRVKVVAPVAGITDLQNYVVDGTVESHCDCMFLVNTYRWDYPLLAALCAPRPLLLENTDADSLFPLDGVMRTRNEVKRIYDLYGASKDFGLVITPGPHQDTQDMQMPVFHWFNTYLKHEDPVIEMAAVKMFSPQELKVFDKIPEDQINTRIESSFVPQAPAPEIPATPQAWKQLQETWTKELREKSFAGWPKDSSAPRISRIFSELYNGIQYEAYEIESQPEVKLRIYLMRRAGDGKPRQILMRVADSTFTDAAIDMSAGLSPAIHETMSFFGTKETVREMTQKIRESGDAQAIFFPRGIGPTAWSGDASRQTVIRRKFMLLGQTLDGMRVWDICRAARGLSSLKEFRGTPVNLEAEGTMGVNALYASLFAPEIKTMHLEHIPSSHADGPDYLNVLKILDIPQTAAMAAEHCNLQLQADKIEDWKFLEQMKNSPAAKLQVELVK